MIEVVHIELGSVYALDLSRTYEWSVCASKGYVGHSQRYAVANLLDKGKDTGGAEHALFLCRSNRSPCIVTTLECAVAELRATLSGDSALGFVKGTRLHVPILPSFLHTVDAVGPLARELRNAGVDPLITALQRRPSPATPH